MQYTELVSDGNRQAKPAKPSKKSRCDFNISTKPQHAVIEIRATHRDAFGPPPRERIDGHADLVRADVHCTTFLDGNFHRKTKVGSQPGRGESITYLELTDVEVAALTPGKHTLAIEIANPDATVDLHVRLLGYSELKR